MISTCEKYKTFDYVFFRSENFDETKKYPTVIHLHGAGGRGRNIDIIKDNPYYRMAGKYGYDFVSFGPQCHAESWFDIFQDLTEFIAHVRELPFVDRDRIYIMGASMGGYATWQMIMSKPNWFAAAVPICGGGMDWFAYRLKGMPIWAYHGKLDPAVKCEESEKMVKRANECGADARLTVVPDVAHDVWNNAYSDKNLFDWMFSQKLGKREPCKDEFNDQTLYG